MKFKGYSKTPQFRDVVRTVRTQADFKGLDENGDAIYEPSKKPTIAFKGTVKLHGTNALVSYDGKELKAGKRSSFVGSADLRQHFGFSNFVYVEHKDYFEYIMSKFHKKYCTENQQVILYGEFSGEGIQKGVGISEFKKSFFYFALRVYDTVTEKSEWIDLDSPVEIIEPNVYSIYDFPTYTVKVDFEKPEHFVNKFVELTEAVENECPVSKRLCKPNTIGEGIVWTGYWKDQKFIFKTKGEKHSTTKVKKIVSIDPEILKNIEDFVNYSATINRVEQGIREVGANSKKDTGDLIRWVVQDIMSEESDVLKSNNLEWQQVAPEVSRRTREIFFNKLDKI